MNDVGYDRSYFMVRQCTSYKQSLNKRVSITNERVCDSSQRVRNKNHTNELTVIYFPYFTCIEINLAITQVLNTKIRRAAEVKIFSVSS